MPKEEKKKKPYFIRIDPRRRSKRYYIQNSVKTTVVKRKPINTKTTSRKKIDNDVEFSKKIITDKNAKKTAFEEIKSLALKVKESNLSLSDNPHFKLLLELVLDNKIDNNLRLKILEELRDIDFDASLVVLEKLLRKISEKIEFKINNLRIINKQAKVIIQGNTFQINKGVIKIEESNKREGYFIDPMYCKYPVSINKLMKEVNELYSDGETNSVFRAVRVLVENYLVEVLAKNYPDNEALWRKEDKILEFSKLITNLFHERNILVNANIRPYSGNIEEIVENLNQIRRRCNNPAHSPIPQTNGQVEELKDYVNRVIPILYELLK